MANATLPTDWLIEACGGKKKQEMPPVMTIGGITAKVTIFPHGEAGMRVKTYGIVASRGCSTFRVSDAMRGFIRLLVDYPNVKLAVSGTKLTITAENCSSALQYHFPNIELTDDNLIPDHAQDIHVVVPCAQWLSLWKSIPPKGHVTIVVDKSRRSVTMKHSRGRWAGAIQAREKPLQSQTFVGDALTTKRIFSYVVPQSTFATVIFMDCGVLRYTDGCQTIYLAPVVLVED